MTKRQKFEEVHEAAKRTAKQKKAQTNTSIEALPEHWDKRVVPYKLAHKKNLTTQRNPEHIPASSTFNFRDSVQIKKEFAEHFPLKRMIHAFNRTRGNVHLEFVSKEEADKVFEEWKSVFLGDSTKIRRAFSTEKPNCAVIIKKVPLDVTDEMIQSCLDTQFADAKATRSIKRDSTKLGTFKLVLKSENDLGKALHQGLFIDSIYFKTTPFVQNGIQVVRCFQCKKFGHISAKCQSAEKCGH